MKERSFDEMIAYFNRRVSEMDIGQDCKMELLGMVTALGYKHEKTAQPEDKCSECDAWNKYKNYPREPQWIPCSERLPEEDYCTGRGIQHSESVLVTIVHHANDDDVFVDMACTVDGKWQLTYPIDDDPDIPKWCEIIAWMALPEPWKGEEHGET